jgi:RNA polymerase sigma-70 factor (ECF subfamily)
MVAAAAGVEPATEFFAGVAWEPCGRAPALLTDAALIGRVRQKDEEALAALYDRHAGMMYGMLLRILKDSGAAEEAIQDLFWEVWRRAEQFDERRGTPLAWLLVMGRSRALSRLRATRRRRDVEVVDEFRPETLSSPSDPESEIARLRLTERLGAALRSLPSKQKQALELAYFEGMTQKEIAARTGSPLGTVKSRIRTALQTLRALVSEWHAPEAL